MPKTGRPSKADTPFSRFLARRGYRTYDAAAKAVADKGFAVSAAVIGRIARGGTPSSATAAIIEKSLGYKASKLLNN